MSSYNNDWGITDCPTPQDLEPGPLPQGYRALVQRVRGRYVPTLYHGIGNTCRFERLAHLAGDDPAEALAVAERVLVWRLAAREVQAAMFRVVAACQEMKEAA